MLCGSRKYPLKEPFVELLKGSLKTFLNAMTAPDKTMYPVASQNRKDFDNLCDVYLDAVLHPRILDPEVGTRTFQQEGWHYEAEAADAPLTYKGVVYNEMKGVYSSADSRNYRAIRKALFHGHPIYGIDSGGDPRAIPQLTCAPFHTSRCCMRDTAAPSPAPFCRRHMRCIRYTGTTPSPTFTESSTTRATRASTFTAMRAHCRSQTGWRSSRATLPNSDDRRRLSTRFPSTGCWTRRTSSLTTTRSTRALRRLRSRCNGCNGCNGGSEAGVTGVKDVTEAPKQVDV